MSDEFDEHPTSEQIKANKKKTAGDDKGNIVQFPEKKSSKEESIEDIINRLNKYFATVLKVGKFKVINKTISGNTIFMDKKDFIDLLAEEKMTVFNTSPSGDLKSKREPVSKLWLEHPKHLKYRQVIFDPWHEFKVDDLDFNMWPGFGIKPKRGCCYKTLQYIRHVLCRGNKEHYRWLMAWTAHMMQRPGEKPETAVAIQGEEEGTGKSFFPMILSRLLDGKSSNRSSKLYFKASNSKLITGDFSGHLEHCILLHAEEAFGAESNREDSIIKDLISGDDIPINAKNIEAKLSRNYIRLILTGNPPHIVKAGRFARRFLVLKISNKHRLDTEFFKGLTHELDNGGYEALMHYLMNYPIHKFNLRVVLKTEGLLEQKIDSMKGEERFWYTLLYTGELPYSGTNIGKYYGGTGTEYMVLKYRLITQFQRFMNKRPEKNKHDEVTFGMAFAKFFPMLDNNGKLMLYPDGKPMKYLKSDKLSIGNSYIMPSLSICRKLFDFYLGQQCEWPDDEEWMEKQFGDT
jgi:Family of unknown function (DUF5906)